jgi:hypothetical protein
MPILKRLSLTIALLLIALCSSWAQPLSCITAIKRVSFDRQRLPRTISPFVPKDAFVRLVLPLSGTETLTIYEMGGRETPDTHLLVTAGEKQVFQYATRRLTPHDDWGLWAVAMYVVHICANDTDLTYVVLQAGNQGGYYIALQRTDHQYRIVPVTSATQGRLVLAINQPRRIEVWDAANADGRACTACAKPFVIKTFEFDGEKFRLSSQHRVKRWYSGFQDKPLVVKSELSK